MDNKHISIKIRDSEKVKTCIHIDEVKHGEQQSLRMSWRKKFKGETRESIEETVVYLTPEAGEKTCIALAQFFGLDKDPIV